MPWLLLLSSMDVYCARPILIFPYFHKSNGKIHFRFVIICEISGFKRLLINCIIDVAYKKKKTARHCAPKKINSPYGMRFC